MTNVVYGQQLQFRGLTVDTITISSSSGAYRFDKGGNTGRSDIYIIWFDKKSNNYYADYKTVYSVTSSNPDTTHEKVKQLSRGKPVLSSAVKGILNAFSSKNLKPTIENLGFNEQQFILLTNEKHIRKVASRHKVNWYFKRSNSSREKNEIIFKGCQKVDSFSLFVSTEFETTNYRLVTDFWDNMKVEIKTAKKGFRFEGHYPNTFKQPWYDHSDTSKFFVPIVNLNINRFLVEILPVKFYRRNTIELQSLTDYYIIWYLKRRGIIYGYD
jgi:hypothetical protein